MSNSTQLSTNSEAAMLTRSKRKRIKKEERGKAGGDFWLAQQSHNEPPKNPYFPQKKSQTIVNPKRHNF